MPSFYRLSPVLPSFCIFFCFRSSCLSLPACYVSVSVYCLSRCIWLPTTLRSTLQQQHHTVALHKIGKRNKCRKRKRHRRENKARHLSASNTPNTRPRQPPRRPILALACPTSCLVRTSGAWPVCGVQVAGLAWVKCLVARLCAVSLSAWLHYPPETAQQRLWSKHHHLSTRPLYLHLVFSTAWHISFYTSWKLLLYSSYLCHLTSPSPTLVDAEPRQPASLHALLFCSLSLPCTFPEKHARTQTRTHAPLISHKKSIFCHDTFTAQHSHQQTTRDQTRDQDVKL